MAPEVAAPARIEEIEEELRKYHPDADLGLLEKGYAFASKVHQGQERRSGEPFLSHPLEVAKILSQLKMDASTITAGLLHDAVEDTLTTIQEVREEFGEEIADLVDGLTKISKLAFRTREDRQAESLRKMVMAMSKDIRVLLIKLADRLHNMRTLDPLEPEKKRDIAQETLDIYAPLAHRLGIAWIKWELEDLALRYLEPEVYDDLVLRVSKKRKEREGEIHEVISILQGRLREMEIKARITGRPKHFYSIFKKMRDQGRIFDEIYDLTAIRIITRSIRDCYGALGIVHSLWKPIPGRFKDFIAMPKSNMYQSLHTTVIGPKGEPVEIQIRTEQMHRTAEEGIAAHWRYKEGRARIDPSDKNFVWLRQLLEWQQDLKDPREFMETVKVDLFPEEVYVFTPKGDVKELPRGATPIDFAFSIHTDVGIRCVGAKVNGKIVPLRYELRNGDIVEIVTSPSHGPSKDWLKIVKTSRARSKVKQWIKKEQRDRSIALGRELCEKEIRKLGRSPGQTLKSENLLKAAERFGFHSEEDLFAAVGYGKLSARQLISRLLPPEDQAQWKELEEAKEKKPEKEPKIKTEEGIKIPGVEDVLVKLSKCCNPLPGDKIV
ncbi:MAG: bifunctional (p)ppGpp synthetase/guanosine-3',5'-bis(diphosphate) 3'-pyrophosphohydrolase, partial [candidate division NC10 bacterium]|nr:bifunctional (p)ppGpp synthetase/guanosine-3',5'-bis(diphosphate) 3'-pyrophosphohydrolase [candidate division NC10 bacterium]